LRRLRAQLARLDHLTRVQALALARIAGLPGPSSEEADAALARALLEMLDAVDPHTRAHCERVAGHAAHLAAELACGSDVIERVRLAASLHDLGKLGVPAALLAKPGPFSAREWAALRRHPELGARMLEPFPSLADVALYVRHHHEWFDGSGPGYPDRLRGAQIPVPSRILSVADALETLGARRTYRRRRPAKEVQAELRSLAGRQFDPEVIEAAVRLLEERGEDPVRAPLRAVEERE
jgi:HD-GYP domain-containing protein (c-di-GMP phosphodiesterase class II)